MRSVASMSVATCHYSFLVRQTVLHARSAKTRPIVTYVRSVVCLCVCVCLSAGHNHELC